MRAITVQPLAAGWSLSISGVANDTLHRSGATAETAARRLAARLAAEGEVVKLIIHLRDGSVAGRFLFTPGSADPDLRWAA